MSSKNKIPLGPPMYRSAKYTDLVVGDECNDVVVIRVYGVLQSCSQIIAKSFLTNPGGALLSNQTLTNLAMPVNPSDAANKEYVDASSVGLKIIDPVQVSTTEDIILSGLQIIDGYSVLLGDRVLVKDQTNGVKNGVYIASAGSWVRSTDMQDGDNASRSAMYVNNGTQNGGGTFVCSNIFPTDVVGTDPLFFSLFIAGTIAGIGLSRVGNTLNVNVDNVGIEINGSNNLQLKDDGVTNSKLIYSSITINSGSGIIGGGSVSLGGSTSLAVDSTVIRTTGAQTMSGPKTFSDKIILGSGLYGISLQAPLISSNYSLVLPEDNGLPNQLLQTDGDGILSWTTTSAGNLYGPNSSTDNAITRYDGITGKLIQNSSVLLSDVGNISGVNILSANYITDGTTVLANGKLSGLLAPVSGSDATNKQYVDGLLAGIKWKEPARVASTVNLGLVGLVVVDGVLVNSGNRVLVKDQTNPVQNGIYNASPGLWTRVSDLYTGSSASGSVVWIEEGSTQAETGFICTDNIGSDIVGINPLTWLQFTGSGIIIAGNGLSKVLNTLNVNVDNSTIEIVFDNLQVKALGITNSQIANNTITNSKLANSSISINTSNGITGGILVSLGGSVSLTVDSTVIRTTGAQNISGPKTFIDSIGLHDPDTPSNIVSLVASTSTTSSYTLTLPVDTGSFGEILTTDGTGVLYWSSGGGGSGNVNGPGSSTDNAIARFNGVTGKIIQNSLVTITDTGIVNGISDITVSGNTSTDTLSIDYESISGQRLYYGYDSVGLISVSSSYQTINLNTDVINDTGYSNSSGEITFTSGGVYEINYHTQFESDNKSGGPKATITSRLEIDSGLGFNPYNGSGSSCYLFEENGNLISFGSGKSVIISINPNDKIRLTFSRTIGTSSCVVKPGESSMSIKRLRP